VVNATTLFSKEWVKAEGMAYVDDADSPTTEGSDFEGSEAGDEEEEGEEADRAGGGGGEGGLSAGGDFSMQRG
jgi:hypothetical protein